MHTRALIIYSIWMFVQIILLIRGVQDWQQKIPEMCSSREKNQNMQQNAEEAQLDCLKFDYDEELIDKLRPNLEVLIVTMTLISFPLNVAIYKWRCLANLILYFELTRWLAQGVLSVHTWDEHSITQLTVLYFCGFICLYTDQVGQLFFSSFVYALQRLCIRMVIYSNPSV